MLKSIIFALLPFVCFADELLPKNRIACYRKDCHEMWYQTYNLTFQSFNKISNMTDDSLDLIKNLTSSIDFKPVLDKIDLKCSKSTPSCPCSYIQSLIKNSTKELMDGISTVLETNTRSFNRIMARFDPIDSANKNIVALTERILRTLGSFGIDSPLHSDYDGIPIFEDAVHHLIYSVGDPAVLLCKAHGHGIYYTLYDNYGTIVSNSTPGFYLTYPFITKISDSGLWYCRATNRHGFSTLTYEIDVYPFTGADPVPDPETTASTKLDEFVHKNDSLFILITFIICIINFLIILLPLIIFLCHRYVC